LTKNADEVKENDFNSNKEEEEIVSVKGSSPTGILDLKIPLYKSEILNLKFNNEVKEKKRNDYNNFKSNNFVSTK